MRIRDDVRVVCWVGVVVVIIVAISLFVRVTSGQRTSKRSEVMTRARVVSINVDEWFNEPFIRIYLDSGVEHVVRASSIDALVSLPASRSTALIINGYSVTLVGNVDAKFVEAMSAYALDQVPPRALRQVIEAQKKDASHASDSLDPPVVEIPDAGDRGPTDTQRDD